MSLLLNRPIPRSSIELGRLVTDPKYPTQDYCQPTVKRENRDVVSGGDDGIGVIWILRLRLRDLRTSVKPSSARGVPVLKPDC